MSNPALINYIRTRLKKGVSPNDIKKELREAGWDEKDVDDVLASMRTEERAAKIQEEASALKPESIQDTIHATTFVVKEIDVKSTPHIKNKLPKFEKNFLTGWKKKETALKESRRMEGGAGLINARKDMLGTDTAYRLKKIGLYSSISVSFAIILLSGVYLYRDLTYKTETEHIGARPTSPEKTGDNATSSQKSKPKQAETREYQPILPKSSSTLSAKILKATSSTIAASRVLTRYIEPTPPEPLPPLSEPEIVTALVTRTSVKIEWAANNPVFAQVEYRSSDLSGRSFVEPVPAFSGTVRIDNLATSTQYSYRLKVVNREGIAKFSKQNTFKTGVPVPFIPKAPQSPVKPYIPAAQESSFTLLERLNDLKIRVLELQLKILQQQI